ncbi:MAG: insulinase family protein [Heliobacteriaceae bacterium]|jgi:zinc protease|nr:insulinase family protein [Heliobacteriaceae bacterium]
MKKILLLLFLLFAGTCSFAAGYSTFKLENGHTVVIQEVKTNPIVTIDTWIRTGSIDETDKNNGTAHFLEHLFFKGTKKHPAGEFDKILENKGAVTNAATSKDFTHYYITIPSKDFDTALELHADMLLNPLIPRKELEMERKVVLEEIAKDKNSPGALVYDNLISMLYTQHPYKRKVIGTNEVISTITRDEILNFYNTYYNPSNMITIIAGDVNTKYALDKVKENFNRAYKKPVKNVYNKEKALTSQKRKAENFPAQSGYMLIGFRGVNVTDRDVYALDVLAAILGEGRSSVLYQSVKEQKQLAFSISASNFAAREDGIFYISLNFTEQKCEKAENAVFEEIQNIQRQGVTEAQLSRAKNVIERDTYYSRESISNIAAEIGYTMVTAGSIEFYENYIGNIGKVTAADVKRAANKYLGTEKSAVSIVLPDNTEKPKDKNINYSTPFSPAAVIITPNDANDIIAISIFAKGGQFLEKIPGTASLTASVMTKGTKKYSPFELAQLLEDNGIKLVPGVMPDAFTLTVLTTKKEYQKTLEILDEVVNNAVFDDYETEKSRTEKLNNIKKNRDIPVNIATEEYKTLIYEGMPYSYSSKVLEKTLPKITREDILSYYDKIFDPQNLVISINGNVDVQSTLKRLGEIFPAKNAEKFDYSAYVIPALKTPKIVTKQVKDLKTDWVIIGWQAAGLLDKKDYAALEVIDAILGSGMSSRLYKNLRISDGLAYQLGSQYGANVLKGAFIVYIGTNPDNLETAKEKLFNEVYRFKTEFVGAKELKEAKEKLIGQYIISQETNMDKASTIGWFEASGRGRDFGGEYERLINSVTVSDIIETANKYFNDNYVLSIVK